MRQRPARIITLTLLLLGVPVIAPAVEFELIVDSPVVGGSSATGQVNLYYPASSSFLVWLSNSNPAVAIVPRHVLVTTGARTATFAVTTVPFKLSSSAVTISAPAGGRTVSGRLTVNP